jgi:hypothetical protein
MKKFSFKKLTTISLFFTSVIFISAFTTCFIPIVSTNRPNDQPNATKIDLADYNNKTLPIYDLIYTVPVTDRILMGFLNSIKQGPSP